MLKEYASKGAIKLNQMLGDYFEKGSLLPDYRYEYDQKVFSFQVPAFELGNHLIVGEFAITRFEIGFWILFAMLLMMHFALKTMGDKKTIFDFMTPANEIPEEELHQQPQDISTDEIRSARMERFKEKRQDTAKEALKKHKRE